MSRSKKILKRMFALPALLFSAALALPMQGQKQGSDYVLPPGASSAMGADGSYGAGNAALANYGYTYCQLRLHLHV